MSLGFGAGGETRPAGPAADWSFARRFRHVAPVFGWPIRRSKTRAALGDGRRPAGDWRAAAIS